MLHFGLAVINVTHPRWQRSNHGRWSATCFYRWKVLPIAVLLSHLKIFWVHHETQKHVLKLFLSKVISLQCETAELCSCIQLVAQLRKLSLFKVIAFTKLTEFMLSMTPCNSCGIVFITNICRWIIQRVLIIFGDSFSTKSWMLIQINILA